MVAVLAAEPGPTVDPAPWKETVVQDSPPARAVDTGADRQAAEPAANAAPKADSTTDRPAVESDATTPGKAGAGAAVVAVLAAAKPSSPVKPVTSVDNASVKSGANALKPGDTRSSGIIESESKAKSPSSTPKPMNHPKRQLQIIRIRQRKKLSRNKDHQLTVLSHPSPRKQKLSFNLPANKMGALYRRLRNQKKMTWKVDFVHFCRITATPMRQRTLMRSPIYLFLTPGKTARRSSASCPNIKRISSLSKPLNIELNCSNFHMMKIWES